MFGVWFGEEEKAAIFALAEMVRKVHADLHAPASTKLRACPR
jgi:hypothetical protein